MSYGINHQVGVKGSPDEIYKHLTETTKLAQWWTTDTRGSGAKVGDTLEFWFSAFCQKFYVKELKPGKRVAWRSPKGQGSDEWTRLKCLSISRQMRSRHSFSLATRVGEKALTSKVIAR